MRPLEPPEQMELEPGQGDLDLDVGMDPRQLPMRHGGEGGGWAGEGEGEGNGGASEPWADLGLSGAHSDAEPLPAGGQGAASLEQDPGVGQEEELGGAEGEGEAAAGADGDEEGHGMEEHQEDVKGAEEEPVVEANGQRVDAAVEKKAKEAVLLPARVVTKQQPSKPVSGSRVAPSFPSSSSRTRLRPAVSAACCTSDGRAARASASNPTPFLTCPSMRTIAAAASAGKGGQSASEAGGAKGAQGEADHKAEQAAAGVACCPHRQDRREALQGQEGLQHLHRPRRHEPGHAPAGRTPCIPPSSKPARHQQLCRVMGYRDISLADTQRTGGCVAVIVAVFDDDVAEDGNNDDDDANAQRFCQGGPGGLKCVHVCLPRPIVCRLVGT